MRDLQNLKEGLVSLKLAKLLAKNGFNLHVRSFYLFDDLFRDKRSIGDYNSLKWVSTWRNSDRLQ